VVEGGPSSDALSGWSRVAGAAWVAGPAAAAWAARALQANSIPPQYPQGGIVLAGTTSSWADNYPLGYS